MSAERPISRGDVAVLLASALGQDKSEQVIAQCARTLGITRTDFSGNDVSALFGILVKAEGLVGVVARFAISRGDVAKLIAKAQRPAAPPATGRPEFRIGLSSGSTPTQAPAIDIMHLIAPALGAEKARDAIEHSAARCGVDIATGLSHSGALAVLDEMTKVEGIVGVVARFAKARFLLNPNG